MESTESDDMRAVDRLGAALGALGKGDTCRASANPAAQDDFGDPGAYRAWLASALLGAAQVEAMTADSMPLSRDARFAIWQRQLSAADVAGDAAAQVELTQWQVQRACAPLPALASEHRTDPIPLAAGQAAEGLQLLLAVMAAVQGAVAESAPNGAGALARYGDRCEGCSACHSPATGHEPSAVRSV